MPVFSKSNRNILFVHIPKCGGSTVEDIARRAGWLETFSVRGRNIKEMEFCKVTPQHMHASLLSEVFYLKEFESIFTLVREPFSRFKSEYYWQRRQKLTELAVSDWIEDTIARYSDDNCIYDNHIRPQCEFIPRGVDVRLFKLEDDGMGKVRDLLGDTSSRILWRQFFGTSLFKGGRKKESKKDFEVESEFMAKYERIVSFYIKDYNNLPYDLA